MDLQTIRVTFCKCNECTTGSALLKETDKSATLTDVTICDIPKNALVVKMDNNVRFSNFFLDKKEWGYNKHSDYLIITDDKLVLVEMKSKKMLDQELQDDCEKKFSSDECTLLYSDHIIEKLMKKNSFFNKREIHFVLLYEAPSITKTPTSVATTVPPNTTPSTFRPIAVPNGATISYMRTL